MEDKIEDPGTVRINVDLQRLWVGSEEQTFAEYIAALAAERLIDGAGANASASLRSRIASVTEEEIRAEVRPMIRRALDTSFQPTDGFGQPKGEPTTLSEQVVKIARKELTMSRGDSYRGNKRTAVEDFILIEVKKAFNDELREVVKAAQADVLAAVHDQAAQVIAETINRLASGRPL